jgi:hypothetical protein
MHMQKSCTDVAEKSELRMSEQILRAKNFQISWRSMSVNLARDTFLTQLGGEAGLLGQLCICMLILDCRYAIEVQLSTVKVEVWLIQLLDLSS